MHENFPVYGSSFINISFMQQKDEKLLDVTYKKDKEIRERNQDVAKRNMELKRKDITISEKDKIISEKDRIISEKDKELKQKDKKIEELTRQLLSSFPDAHMCTVEEFPDKVYVNKEESMVVTLKNCHGKLMNNCRDCLSITVRNQNVLQPKVISFSITELQNGHYNVSFIITKIGCYWFSILVDGKDILNFPCK